MPLELGIFFGALYYGKDEQKRKKCLIMEAEPYKYQQSVSDLAGHDIYAHGGDPNKVIKLVRDWLRNISKK